MDEKRDALDEALWYVGETAKALAQLGGFEDAIAALEETGHELQLQIDDLDEAIRIRDERELRAMNREYWRSVI